MERFSRMYAMLEDNDPNCELLKASDARVEAQLALEKAMAAVMAAKEAEQKAEIDHYKKYFNTARAEFGDRAFTAAELEEMVGYRISKNSVASMVAYAKLPESLKVWSNKKNRRTEKLLPSDLTDTGEYKKVERYFLPCDASGKPIEGADPVKMTSKGSKLYKFGD